MTVGDFMNVLVHDNKVTISVQTRNEENVHEIFNDNSPFGNSTLGTIANKEVKFLKIEKKYIYIFV